jgi:hypothetical protein
MQTSQELQGRKGQEGTGGDVPTKSKPLIFRQWRPPSQNPGQSKSNSFEFVFYAGPAQDSMSTGAYSGRQDNSNWKFAEKGNEASDKRGVLPIEVSVGTRKYISPYQIPPPRPTPNVVTPRQDPISTIHEEERDEPINYIRPIPPERLKKLELRIKATIDDDLLAEQQLITEHQLTLRSKRPRSKKQTLRTGVNRVKGWKSWDQRIRKSRGSQEKEDSQGTCEENLIDLATGALRATNHSRRAAV